MGPTDPTHLSITHTPTLSLSHGSNRPDPPVNHTHINTVPLTRVQQT